MLFCVLPLPSRAAGAAPSVDLGVGLGGGATGYTVENLHQNGAAEESLKAVVKWRQDALNDTSVKWNGKTMKHYLADNDISESDYLNPKWSNALERIAIQRAIEAWDYNDGHTRPNGGDLLDCTVRFVSFICRNSGMGQPELRCCHGPVGDGEIGLGQSVSRCGDRTLHHAYRPVL